MYSDIRDLKDSVMGDTWAWHIHHDVLVEPLRESLEDRRHYIRTTKRESERPRRLVLLRLVKGSLPPALVAAGRAYYQAWQASRSAWRHDRVQYDERDYLPTPQQIAYHSALAALDTAILATMPALYLLHAAECPKCPWNGKTIFPEYEN